MPLAIGLRSRVAAVTRTRRQADRWFVTAMIAPVFIVVVFVVAFPLLYSFYLSFTNFNLLNAEEARFIGLANYRDLLQDPVFLRALVNTLVFVAIAVNAELLLGLAISQLIARAVRNLGLIRTLIMVPMMFAPVLIGFQFKWFFNDQVGLVNNLISAAKGETVVLPWLVNFPIDMLALLVAEIWMGTPLMVIILLAGTLSLPHEPFEAAAVDGASAWQRFRHLTLPLITPFIYVALAIRSLDISRAYDIVRIMTDGGPAHRTELIWTYVFRLAISNADFGLGSAMSFVTVIFSLLFTVYFFWQLSRVRRESIA